MRLDFTNDLALCVLIDGSRFLGIDAVTCDGLDLRATALPWLIHAESEQGLRFTDWTFIAVEESGDERTIVARARGAWMPRLQEADAMGDAPVPTRRQAAGEATLRWTFRPLEERIAGRPWRGLGMRVASVAYPLLCTDHRDGGLPTNRPRASPRAVPEALSRDRSAAGRAWRG